MYVQQVENSNECKNKVVANAVSQKNRSSKSIFQFVDNRFDAFDQKKLQAMVNTSLQSKPAAQLQAKSERRAPIQLRPVIVQGGIYLTAGDLPGTHYRLVRRPRSQVRRLNNTNSHTLLPPNITAADATILMAHIAALQADGVSNLNSLVAGIANAEGLGIPNSVSIARLGLIQNNVQNVIRIRVLNDHAIISAMFPPGTIDPVFANAFDSIKIPGSDPHKGGQVVAFINYHNLLVPNTTVRIVYKPGNLRFDQLLYDSAGSVAATLGGDLASYRIAPQGPDALAAANPKLQHYAYMEYVRSGTPATAADLRGVYRSLGANLAMAYVYGLRDIHHENFKLLQDKIQFIDMEAGTSTYTGFNSMELLSLPNALRDKLADAFMGINNATLGGLAVNDAGLITELRNGFTNTLTSMYTGGPNNAAMNLAVQQTTHTETRFVPFPTTTLQGLAAQYHGKLGPPPPAAFPVAAPIPADEAAFRASTRQLAHITATTAGNTHNLRNQFRRMLRSQACRQALNVGDVPFWSRRGNSIYGEDGVLVVHRLQHNRLNRSNQNMTDANARRAPGNAIAALNDFNAQVVPMIGTPMTNLVNAHLMRRIQQGHVAPNF